MKRTIALLLALAMTLALCGCGKSEAVKSVEEEIASLDRVLSLDDAPAVSSARAAYDRLEEKEQRRVSNIRVLIDAEAAMEDLREQARQKALEWQASYDGIVRALGEAEDACDAIIDMYAYLAIAAGLVRHGFHSPIGSDKNEYYEVIRFFDGTATLEDFQARYGTDADEHGTPAWQRELFLAAVVVCRETYTVDMFAPPAEGSAPTAKVEPEDADLVIQRCEELNARIDSLAEKLEQAETAFAALRDAGEPDRQAALAALETYCQATDRAVRFVLSPSGDLNGMMEIEGSLTTLNRMCITYLEEIQPAMEQARAALNG